jgi:hypothetical protein
LAVTCCGAGPFEVLLLSLSALGPVVIDVFNPIEWLLIILHRETRNFNLLDWSVAERVQHVLGLSLRGLLNF